MEQITSIVPIDYHVRIHQLSSCVCKNISSLFGGEKNRDKFTYVIEKEWNDDHCKDKPKYIFVPKNNVTEYMNKLFGQYISSKKLIWKYFKKNKWSSASAEIIRFKIDNSIGMFICTNTAEPVKKFFNGGIFLIGSKNQMENISHLFNKNRCTNDEYDRLTICRVNSLPDLMHTYETSHSFSTVAKNIDMQNMTDDLYTIVGIESFTNKLSFSFGKREWLTKLSEDSYDCAKRELFEEFHIQLSKNIYQMNSGVIEKNCISKNNTNIFMIWLSQDSQPVYYRQSKTIYIS